MRRRIIPTATRLKSTDDFDDFVIAWPKISYNARVQKATGAVSLFTFKRWEKVRLVRYGQLIDGVKAALFNLKTEEANAKVSDIAVNSNAFRGAGAADPVGCDQPATANEARAEAALASTRPLQPGERRFVGTVDATPTWASLLPDLLKAWTEGSVPANDELARMALAADAWVAHQKAGAERMLRLKLGIEE